MLSAIIKLNLLVCIIMPVKMVGQPYVMIASNLGLMSAPVSLSYTCKSTQVIEFDDGTNSITVAYSRAEAFHTELALGDGRDFGPSNYELVCKHFLPVSNIYTSDNSVRFF